jgi:hypothetical protein
MLRRRTSRGTSRKTLCLRAMEPKRKLSFVTRSRMKYRLRTYWRSVLEQFAPRAPDDLRRAEERLRSKNEPRPPAR